MQRREVCGSWRWAMTYRDDGGGAEGKGSDGSGRVELVVARYSLASPDSPASRVSPPAPRLAVSIGTRRHPETHRHPENSPSSGDSPSSRAKRGIYSSGFERGEIGP